ncbi:MAG: ParB N-terminal domain-containing protein [Candidatus Zambryskibacteria bacterium]|nr:ParB N-terminal domain-containing protein [Candidatus Zambryskibacteria bacterium]
MSRFYNDSIFWIEVDKIKPNPYQPRREFDEAQLKSLADSVRQYGVLQALVVTRNEASGASAPLAWRVFSRCRYLSGPERKRI